MNTAANDLQTSHNAEVLPSITRRLSLLWL